MAYSLMVEEYNDLIQNQVADSREADEAGISDEQQSKLAQWKERADEYSEKFSALADGGLGELAGMAGLSNTYSKLMDIRKRYKKFMGDGENASQVNPGGLTLDPEQALTKLTDGELSDLIPQGSKDILGKAINTAKEVKQSVVDSVSKAPDLARATIVDPAKAGAVAVKDTAIGDVNLTADDLDNIIQRNLADVDEGIGRQAAPLTQQIGGLTFGKTGRGADLVAEAQQSTSFGAPQNLRQGLRAVQGEASGSTLTTARQPIDVGKIGVKASAKEFDALSEPLAQGIMQQGANPPSALDLQLESAQAKLKDTFKKLPKADRQKVLQAQERGEIQQESLGDIQELQKQFDDRLASNAENAARAEAERSSAEDFLGGIGKTDVSARVAATADVKPQPATEFLGDIEKTDVSERVAETKEIAPKVAEETAEKAGEDVGEKFAADEAIGSVAGPIGEAIGAVAGIFTSIDGLIHLFHHKQAAVPQVRNLGNMAPEINTQVTSKFSSAIPTIDSAQEVSGAIASF
jgi:hypothetical protein